MNKKYNFQLDNYHSDYPLAFASFATKTGTKVGGLMLVDTASRHNILNPQIEGLLGSNRCGNGHVSLTSFRGESVDAHEIGFCFSIDNVKFDETFYVSKEICFDSIYEGHVVVGIIGVDFLLKYGFVLDFLQKTLHSPEMTTGYDNADFVFPLHFGFSKYGFPVILMTSKEKGYVCLVDSGSCYNITTMHVLDSDGIEYSRIGKGKSFNSLSHTIDADLMNVSIELASMNPLTELFSKHSFLEPFYVVNTDSHIISGGTGEIPPISMILGANFLKKHGCIIDFSNKLIYSRHYMPPK